MNKKNESSSNFTSKIRSSLVLKLNFQMLSRLVTGFLSVNLLIISMIFILFIWKSEEGARYIFQSLEKSPSIIGSIPDGEKYIVLSKQYSMKGVKLSNSIQNRMPLNIKGMKRKMGFPKNHKELAILEKVFSIRYIIEIPFENIYYQIIYPLGSDIRLFSPLFLIILIIQLSIVLGSMRKGYKTIRKTLQPIAELAKTAENLNAEVSDGRELKDLAGAIGNIDANRLDSYISVDSSQDELKDLATAINSMLNRINDSYQSQMRFVSDASHELRTPISVIQGYANLLDRWGKNDPKALQESIDAIKSETTSMKDLVEQLLFLARGDNETIILHRETFDCAEIMEEIIRETKMINADYNFDISLDKPAYINADKQLLKQALRILIDNSIKFTQKNDRISLRIIKKEKSIHLVVQDEGIGIDSKDLARIFDRFYRSDESRARKTGGSGLGLSIAKWIIERHDAYFEILSRIDIGTRITIVFDEAEEEGIEL